METPVGIALGANLGDRLATLSTARDLLAGLAQPGSLRQAPVYRSAPVACPADSPEFLNTVVEIHTALAPADLLSQTLAIEARLGRVRRTVANAPRPIDLDLLYYGSRTLDTPTLTLPHPRLRERRFVLQPLADLRPDLVLPGDSRPIRDWLATLADMPLAVAATDW